MTSKIWTSLHYLETIVFDNDDYLFCVYDAGRGVEPMVTRQEFTAVGPYVPCNSTYPAFREPATAYTDPVGEVSRAREYLADALADDYPSTITIRCTTSTAYTAQTGAEFTPGHRSGYTIDIGYGPQFDRPGHQPLTSSTLADVGPTFDYAAAEHSYPVDELAGIIAHEILHTHGYEHGDVVSNQCRYGSWDCSGSSGSTSCRANSMNEIFEACVSEVVERSVQVCSSARWANRIPIAAGGRRLLPLVENGSCSGFPILSDARDRWGQGRTEYEMDVDRYGHDYTAITASNQSTCRNACMQDWRCFSYTYLAANNGCYLKAAVAPPSRRAGAVSGVVRVNDGSGERIDLWDRYANTTSSGASIQTITTTASDCEQRCITDVRCRVYTHASGQCNLRSSRGTFTALAGSTTVEVRTLADNQSQRGVMFNAHYPIAVGFTAYGLGDGGYESCVELCHANSTCQGFNYFPDNHCEFDVCDPVSEYCYEQAPYAVPGGLWYTR